MAAFDAYYANFCYATRRDYCAAIDACNEALIHCDNSDKRRRCVYFYNELVYVVTLSNRFSPIFDEFLQCVIGCMTLVDYCNSGRRRVADNVSVPVCTRQFIYYIKLRCLRELGAHKEMWLTLHQLGCHVRDNAHSLFSSRGLDKALLAACCGFASTFAPTDDYADLISDGPTDMEDVCTIC